MIKLCIAALLCVSAALNAAPAAMTFDDMFAGARNLYAAGQYDSTIARIQGYLKKHGKDSATAQVVPLLMEALGRTGDTELTIRLFAIYEKKFPDSPFLPRLRYLNGVALCREERFEEAVTAFSQALDNGLNPRLDSLALAAVGLVCRKALTPEELTVLSARRGLSPRVLEIIRYNEVVRQQDAGKTIPAEQAAQKFLDEFPRSKYEPAVRDAIGRTRTIRRDQVAVGLLAPLSGEYADIGKKVVEGVQFAVERYNRGQGPKINLVICDTRGSMVETARKTMELIEQHKAPAIIGPVLSQEAAVTAGILIDRDDVLMISPTATDDGIASLGPNVFQMNVTMAELGRKIASYAMDNLNIRDFAVLSPTSEYGRLLSESFTGEVREKGGEIVADVRFEEGANDFRAQFDELRLQLARRMRQTDSLGFKMASGRQRPGVREDSLYWADSVLSVGGLFIPAECEDVIMVAPQVFFYKIRTQLLGATGWHASKTILDGKRYVENALIVTGAETEKTGKEWNEFRLQFKDRFSGEPDQVTALGFDAADLVCRAVAAAGGAVTARQLSQWIGQVQNFKGISGAITFDPARRTNREAVIVKIADKRFIRVQ